MNVLGRVHQHLSLPASIPDRIHLFGRVKGNPVVPQPQNHVILLVGGKRIYIAGDTDAVKEIKQVKCDIAMVPIGGTYTMDARQAAQLINTLSPEIAIPTHYGTIVGKAADAEIFQREVKLPTRVEIIKKY